MQLWQRISFPALGTFDTGTSAGLIRADLACTANTLYNVQLCQNHLLRGKSESSKLLPSLLHWNVRTWVSRKKLLIGCVTAVFPSPASFPASWTWWYLFIRAQWTQQSHTFWFRFISWPRWAMWIKLCTQSWGNLKVDFKLEARLQGRSDNVKCYAPSGLEHSSCISIEAFCFSALKWRSSAPDPGNLRPCTNKHPQPPTTSISISNKIFLILTSYLMSQR